MNRRNVLIGLTAAATGSSVVFGSGAFTQVEAERNITIRVSEDSSALLKLDAGSNVASVYNDGSTGELVIDTDELSDSGDTENNQGFNVNATAQIGSTENDLPDPGSATVSDSTNYAFKLTNQFDTVAGSDNDSDEIDIEIDLSGLSAGDSTLNLIGTEYDGSNDSQDTDKIETLNTTSGSSSTFEGVPAGNAIYFAIQIDTGTGTDPADFDGTITFTATPQSN